MCGSTRKDGLFSAWGKVILVGEHAVVHGSRAIAASLCRAATAAVEVSRECALHVCDARGPWRIGREDELFRAYKILCERIGIKAITKVRVNLPTSAGLGSSASMGVAIVRALFHAMGHAPSDNEVIDTALLWEKVFHGNPSGVDVCVATIGKCIVFSRSDGWKNAHVACDAALCIGDSGVRSSTRKMVQKVTDILALRQDGGVGWVKEVNDCVERVRYALSLGCMDELAAAMRDNGELLREVGVYTPETDDLCRVALDSGAAAAKVTGAGGGGCVIVLSPGCSSRVLRAWRNRGFDGFAVNIGPQVPD